MKNERSIDKTENKTAVANQFHTHRALIGFDEHEELPIEYYI